jgi:hypothetical protein
MNSYIHNRNFGCRYREIIENGFRSLMLENEVIRVCINLDKGSDIYEFLYKPKDMDFMWRSPLVVRGDRRVPFTKNLEYGNFLDIYEGGWQDILPNIGDPTNYKNAGLGVHGELYTLPWGYEKIIDDPAEVKLRLHVRMVRVPFFVTRVITIKRIKPIFEIIETIKNEGDEDISFMWGQHIALGEPFLDDSCVIDVPAAIKSGTSRKSISENNIIPLDKKFNWPYIETLLGDRLDLSKVMSPDKKTAFSVYLENLSHGWFGITNLNEKIGFGLKWDTTVFKHIWMWMVYRGSYGFPWYGRTYNVALEPWSSLPDNFDEAFTKGNCLKLLPGETLTTSYVALIYESEKRIKGFDEEYNILKVRD